MKMNIVFALPGRGDYQTEARPLATFYAGFLGMTFLREDWYIIAESRELEPHLAFGDGPSPHEMPRWPDPAYPAQMHLDIAVPDLRAAAEHALSLGATRLHDEHHIYADLVGHPFRLYEEAVPSARIGRVVIDCFSPRSLAPFYVELLEMPVRDLDTPERVVIGQEVGHDGPDLPRVALQHVPEFTAPRWPDPAYPAQVHFDIYPNDSVAAQERALQLGAIRLPDLGGSCPVYADPAGHPFCLCGKGQ